MGRDRGRCVQIASIQSAIYNFDEFLRNKCEKEAHRGVLHDYMERARSEVKGLQ